MQRRQFIFALLIGFWAFALPAFAQWPESADTNLVICNHASEQVLPKIGATSDGGCYISWYDLASGSYDVYLQRLDGNGVEQFADNGLLISSHAQESWLTDWDMTVDAEDHAIVVFNDIRAGGDWDIYAYRISPAGTFVWGADGITISDNAEFEAAPRVCVTSGGNVVIAWQRELAAMVVNVRKLTSAGTDVWSPAIKTISSTYGITWPSLAATENDGIMVQFVVAQGSQYWSPKHIYAEKFDSSGNAEWGADLLVSNAGGLGPQMIPDLVSDGSGGAYSYWYDGRVTNELHVYAQHILSGGTVGWTANGVRAANAAGQLEMSPTFAPMAGSDLLTLFYQISDLDQNNWGVGGQALDAAGASQWTANGIAFVPMNDQQRFFVTARPMENDVAVSYFEFIPGSNVNDVVKAFRVNASGAFVWPDSPRMLSSVTSAKGRLVGTVNNAGQFLNAWSDQRSDGGDIYLQNINPDGSLGPLGGNQPPGNFMRVSPADSVLYDTLYPVVLRWTPSIDPDGDLVTYLAHFWSSDYSFLEDSTYVTTDTAVQVEIPIPVSPLDEIFHFHWRVFATDGQDTVEAANGEGMFILDIILNADENSIPHPSSFRLSAYPNPFNPQTTISFDLPAPARVELNVYDLTGRLMATLATGERTAGGHTVIFDASALPSGMYLTRLQTPDYTATQKILLLR